MEINYKIISGPLKKLKKKELLKYIKEAIRVMNQAQLQDVFGDILIEKKIRPMKPEAVLEAITKFRADSISGKYYAPFDMNSKNFMDIPPETDEWFTDLGIWLDRSCELVQEGHLEIAQKCFAICMELIQKMEHGEEIVFADEYGDWMIITKHDYELIYKQLTEKQ